MAQANNNLRIFPPKKIWSRRLDTQKARRRFSQNLRRALCLVAGLETSHSYNVILLAFINNRFSATKITQISEPNGRGVRYCLW
jgi:hypothetical protein